MPPNPLVKKGDTTYLRLIWEELFDGNLGAGSSGGAIGPPIPGATFIVAAPQFGDTEEGVVDGVWHPALGQPIISADPTARNGIPAEAQSLLFLVRLSRTIINSTTDEAWDLKNIAAYVRLDGGAPSFDDDSGIRGFPIGGVFAKAWVDRESALQAIAESRWRPSPGLAQPYPNYRAIAEVNCYRQTIPAPVFEPSLLVLVGGAESTTTPAIAQVSVPDILSGPLTVREHTSIRFSGSTYDVQIRLE